MSSLTLQSCRDIIPGTDLLRRHKAWCPVCFEEWKNSQQPIYEPIIWSFKSVEVCEFHNVHLETYCPFCGAQIQILSRNARNGYCSFCSCWLGSQNAYSRDNESAISSWDSYVVSNIGNLLINGAQLTTNYFTNFIGKLISLAGGLNAFTQYFNIAKSTASEWCNGLHKPSLCMILQLFYSLGLNVLDLNQPFTLPEKKQSEEKTNSIQKPERRRINWDNVKIALIDIINHFDTHAPSVREVARKLNIDKRLLYYHYSELCKKISINHSLQTPQIKKQSP